MENIMSFLNANAIPCAIGLIVLLIAPVVIGSIIYPKHKYFAITLYLFSSIIVLIFVELMLNDSHININGMSLLMQVLLHFSGILAALAGFLMLLLGSMVYNKPSIDKS
jgi:hypothetical protein